MKQATIIIKIPDSHEAVLLHKLSDFLNDYLTDYEILGISFQDLEE